MDENAVKRQDSLESTEGSETKIEVDDKDFSRESTRLPSPVNNFKDVTPKISSTASTQTSSRSVRFADEVEGGALTEEYIVESYKHVSF
jgi:hypothetical protein